MLLAYVVGITAVVLLSWVMSVMPPTWPHRDLETAPSSVALVRQPEGNDVISREEQEHRLVDVLISNDPEMLDLFYNEAGFHAELTIMVASMLQPVDELAAEATVRKRETDARIEELRNAPPDEARRLLGLLPEHEGEGEPGEAEGD